MARGTSLRTYTKSYGSGMVTRVSVQNLDAIQAQFLRLSDDAAFVVRRVTHKYGVILRDRTVLYAAKKTGYMARSTKLTFGRGGLAFEVGWYEDDFTPHGLKFYPPYVEFGTRLQRAQPALLPAYDETIPEYLAELRIALREAADFTLA